MGVNALLGWTSQVLRLEWGLGRGRGLAPRAGVWCEVDGDGKVDVLMFCRGRGVSAHGMTSFYSACRMVRYPPAAFSTVFLGSYLLLMMPRGGIQVPVISDAYKYSTNTSGIARCRHELAALCRACCQMTAQVSRLALRVSAVHRYRSALVISSKVDFP